MKKRKKIFVIIIFSLLLFILYFLFFPYETEKELILKPRIVHNLGEDEAVPLTVIDDNVYSFKVGQDFGFLNKNGDILFKESVLYNVAISDHSYINYSSIQDSNQSLVVMDALGNYRQSFRLPGYPFFSDDGTRLFIINTNATGIREVTLNGEKAWKSDFSSLITAFSSNAEYALVGLLNGTMKVFNRTGECIYSYEPKKSRLSIVYGTALSKNQKTMAVLSGIDPQNLLFFKKSNNKYHNPVKKEIAGELRRPAFLGYTYNDKFLLFESQQGLNAMEVKSLRTYSFPVQGRLSHIDTHPEKQLITAAFLSKKPSVINNLCLCKPGNMIFIRKNCTKEVEFLRFVNDQLIVGFEKILLVFDIMEV